MAFTLFPQFIELRFEDRQEFESYTKNLPPVDGITFMSMMVWWGLYRPPKVAVLNSNLVIQTQPVVAGEESEFSIFGINQIDESICTIFDYLRELGKPARLVHVPEFVLESMYHPELIDFKDERGSDEYVIELSKFYPLERSPRYQRYRAARFMKNAQGRHVKVGPVDLSVADNQQLLLDADASWPAKGLNKASPRIHEVLQKSIRHAPELEMHNVCLFIDDQLHSFLTFLSCEDARYVNLQEARMSYAIPDIFNYAVYSFAEWFAKQGVEYVNVGIDYNILARRVGKLVLGPTHFFRRYTIEPTLEASLLETQQSSL